MSALRAIVTGLLLSVAGAASASAQAVTPVTQDGIAFDDAKHRGWYVRFWTGSCKELRVICMSGAPYWGEIMQRLLVNVPPQQQEKLRTRLVLLGQRIGYEWAKENDVRRINNDHIKTWSADLKQNVAAPEPAVARIEQQARQLLGGTGDPRPAHAARR
jgi:predicted secreted protein